jgi:hypothetical protein
LVIGVKLKMDMAIEPVGDNLQVHPLVYGVLLAGGHFSMLRHICSGQ